MIEANVGRRLAAGQRGRKSVASLVLGRRLKRVHPGEACGRSSTRLSIVRPLGNRGFVPPTLLRPRGLLSFRWSCKGASLIGALVVLSLSLLVCACAEDHVSEIAIAAFGSYRGAIVTIDGKPVGRLEHGAVHPLLLRLVDQEKYGQRRFVVLNKRLETELVDGIHTLRVENEGQRPVISRFTSPLPTGQRTLSIFMNVEAEPGSEAIEYDFNSLDLGLDESERWHE